MIVMNLLNMNLMNIEFERVWTIESLDSIENLLIVGENSVDWYESTKQKESLEL